MPFNPDRVTCILQKPLKLQTVFIGHARVIGGKPPMRAQDVAIIQAQCDVGVADVDCEKHGDLWK
jgi:hypothetical protein